MIQFIKYSHQKSKSKTTNVNEIIKRLWYARKKDLIWTWIRQRPFQPSRKPWFQSNRTSLGLETPIPNPYPFDTQCTKRALMQLEDNAGPDQPAHKRMLIRPSLSAYRINEYYRICLQTQNAQIRLHLPHADLDLCCPQLYKGLCCIAHHIHSYVLTVLTQ